jgi:IS30 family transposase
VFIVGVGVAASASGCLKGGERADWATGRGANENMNGLIRQFFPKKMRFDSITAKDTTFTMHRLNHRPTKCLGFKTPHEVFMNQLHSRQNAVALQT